MERGLLGRRAARIAGGIIFAAIASPSFAQVGPRADNVARMDQIVRSYGDAKQFMGSVLVARDGRVLLDKGFGYANLEWNMANDPDTVFRLGSVTKQFTAAAIGSVSL